MTFAMYTVPFYFVNPETGHTHAEERISESGSVSPALPCLLDSRQSFIYTRTMIEKVI